MPIKEIRCKTILTTTKLKSIDYTINPYFGCQHACRYCYCRELCERFGRHSGHEAWGSFVDVKVNATDVLNKELKKNPTGIVWLSSATDPYQPIERKYELTRKILNSLLNSRLKIDILTKAAMVTRDIDIFKQFGNRIIVGFTINMLDDSFRKELEPGAATIEARISQLAELKDTGIPVYASFGPIFPFITDVDALFKLFSKLGIRYTFTESLNTRGKNWIEVRNVLEQKYPELLPKYEDIFFNPRTRREWHKKLAAQILHLSNRYGIKCDIYFDFVEKFKIQKAASAACSL